MGDVTRRQAFVENGVPFRDERLRARKRFVGGTQRTATPEETLERVRPALRATGISRLADITGLDRIGVHTTLAFRPNSPTLSNASGKGATLVASMTSAAMEGIEIFHAETIRTPTFEATYDEVAAEWPAVTGWDVYNRTRHAIIRRDTPMMWLRAWDLVSDSEVPVPYLLATMGEHPRQRPRPWMPFPCGSNGLASGNDPAEALHAALLEVVERDATASYLAAWGAALGAIPRYRLDSVTDDRVLELLGRFETADIGVVLFDCTVDTGVPVCMAYNYDRRDRHLGIYRGYGAHLDPAIAMMRALTESAQSRAIYIAGSRDDYYRHDRLRHRLGDSGRVVRLLRAMPENVEADRYPDRATPTFEEDLGILVDRIRAVGLDEVLVVDLTKPELDIPVVRVVVPGLEGYPFQHYRPGPRARALTARIAGEDAASGMAAEIAGPGQPVAGPDPDV